MSCFLRVTLLMLLLMVAAPVQAAGAKIKKVLPHYFDQQGRHTLSPSLYERDAYQAHLRRHPEKRAGMRFDVRLKPGRGTNFVLKLDLRGSKGKKPTKAAIQSSVFSNRRGSLWQSVTLDQKAYADIGEILAWRASLWNGDEQIAEQRSFLW